MLKRPSADHGSSKSGIRFQISVLPTPAERAHRDTVMADVAECIRTDQTIKLPKFDPAVSQGARLALTNIGAEPNPFSGTADGYRYQFEGEEDLLHLIVTRLDEQPLTPEEGQQVAKFVLGDVPSALVWLRPGEYSQHFYLAHDVLVW